MAAVLQDLTPISALPGFRGPVSVASTRIGQPVNKTDKGGDATLPKAIVHRRVNRGRSDEFDCSQSRFRKAVETTHGQPCLLLPGLVVAAAKYPIASLPFGANHRPGGIVERRCPGFTCISRGLNPGKETLMKGVFTNEAMTKALRPHSPQIDRRDDR